jgi:Arc/MetJ-type ribon-helix-helix transcriptional regulator
MVSCISGEKFMAYQFPPDVEKLLREQMAAGQYRSEDELLLDALKALDQQRQTVFEEDPVVVAGIRRGLADMTAGRSRTVDEFDSEFRAQRDIPKNA